MLARDVPHCDVQRAQRSHDRRAPEVGVAVHILPVVFDAQRVLAHQVSREQLDSRLRRLQVTPRSRLADARDSLVRMNLREQVAAHADSFHFRYLHRFFSVGTCI